MRLSELLKDVKYKGDIRDREIKNIVTSSQSCEESMFICIEGEKFDGHLNAAEALKNGAELIVAHRDLGLENQIIVENTRAAYAQICANYFGRPSQKLKLVGVTGTNGKTTVTSLIKQMLEHKGVKTGLIGTICNEIDSVAVSSQYTTPDPMILNGLFARMVSAGCKVCVMEVSSHALEQHRVDGCMFETSVFTNLTQDHLDYHKSMQSYYNAKKKLFSMTKNANINIDDTYGRKLIEEIECGKQAFSIAGEADFYAKNIELLPSSSRFAVVHGGEEIAVSISTPGLFSISNAVAAVAAMCGLGFSFAEAAALIPLCKSVRGRAEVIDFNTPFTIMFDYAHTPDALEKILSSVRGFTKGRVITLFGCGGNRDASKRPLMAAVAASLSDFVIITSDNPRDEDPNSIIEDIAAGLEGYKTPHREIVSRYEAIEYALGIAEKDDLLLLAGKGHEDYQILSFGKVKFDEREIILQILDNNARKGKIFL